MPKKDKNILTKIQLETLDAIKSYITERKESPSLTEIGKILKIHPQTVVDRLRALQKKGFIRKVPHKWKNIEIIERATSENNKFIQIPVIASVGADNMSVFAEQEFGIFLQIEEKLMKGYRDVFAVRAIGNSMRDANIKDGGYVFAESVKQDEVKSGSLVVAIVEDKAVVKRVEFKDNAIILKPENNSEIYQPIVVPYDKEDFKIIGRVIDTLSTPDTGEDDMQVVYDPHFNLNI